MRMAEILDLRRAVGGDQTGLLDLSRSAGTCNLQASGLEVRPGLLRAITPDWANVEPIALGKRVRDAGFDFRREAGKQGESDSDKCSNSDG
jgi:hypothetical protein